MTTWQLWRALNHPSKDHPLYQHVRDDIYDDRTRWTRRLQNLLTQGQLWLWPLLFMTNMRTIPLVIFGGTLGGMIWATIISSRIHAEQDKHHYDLLCVTPDGIIGVVWAIITGCLHRERVFETHQFRRSVAHSHSGVSTFYCLRRFVHGALIRYHPSTHCILDSSLYDNFFLRSCAIHCAGVSVWRSFDPLPANVDNRLAAIDWISGVSSQHLSHHSTRQWGVIAGLIPCSGYPGLAG